MRASGAHAPWQGQPVDASSKSVSVCYIFNMRGPRHMQTIDESELVKRAMDAYRWAAHDAFPAVTETPSGADVHWRPDGAATVRLYNRNDGTIAKYEWDGAT